MTSTVKNNLTAAYYARAMRIAFLTSEYPSELPNAGGLATYVHRMARLLLQSGHEAEVFVPGSGNAETISHEGVPVHRVGSTRHLLPSRLSRLVPVYSLGASVDLWLQARALANALEERHRAAPFDLVQSADYRASGLFVPHVRGRVHVIRCSSAADLYNGIDGVRSVFESFRGWLERRSMRRADVAYAPSQYLAEHFRRVHGIDVRVVRPPMHVDRPTVAAAPAALPERYFIHFGLLMARKGTALLARALPLAWKQAPDLTMVWCGKVKEPQVREWRTLWGDKHRQVHIAGPLSRPQLYAALQSADVAVLPSQVDNLPNTVIESLSMGIPVLGSRGASIDEMVEEDRTGHLVALGDAQGLADALVRMWLRQSPVSKGFVWDSAITKEMMPEKAVASLTALANK